MGTNKENKQDGARLPGTLGEKYKIGILKKYGKNLDGGCLLEDFWKIYYTFQEFFPGNPLWRTGNIRPRKCL